MVKIIVDEETAQIIYHLLSEELEKLKNNKLKFTERTKKQVVEKRKTNLQLIKYQIDKQLIKGEKH